MSPMMKVLKDALSALADMHHNDIVHTGISGTMKQSYTLMSA